MRNEMTSRMLHKCAPKEDKNRIMISTRGFDPLTYRL
jgi:hypothetical protein